MSEMKKLLLDEREDIKGKLERIDAEQNKSEYGMMVNRITDVEKLLVDLEKKELEVEAEAARQDIDESLKTKQMSEDKKSQRNRNIVEVVKIGAPIVAAFAMGIISMKWEKVDTVTSTAGKSALRDVMRFKW